MTKSTSIRNIDRDASLAEMALRNKEYTDWIKLGIKHKDFDKYYHNLELAYTVGRNDRVPEKCEDCDKRLSRWVGSHTCIRSVRPRIDDSQISKGGQRIIHFEVHWVCTDCFLSIFSIRELKEAKAR